MSYYDLESACNTNGTNTLGAIAFGTNKKNRVAASNIYQVSILVFVWYSAALFSVTSSKQIMNRCKMPFLLCAIQFFCAALITKIYLYISKSNNAKSVSDSLQSLLFQISASYTFGFVLTNCAFSIGMNE